MNLYISKLDTASFFFPQQTFNNATKKTIFCYSKHIVGRFNDTTDKENFQ